MRSAFWPVVLTLAMLAGAAAPRHMHLHAANGTRAVHDAHHQGAESQPLLHSHVSPHHHDESTPEESEPEDVLAVTGGICTVATPYAPDLVMMAEGPVALSPPLTAYRPLTVHQPPSHAPPSHSAVGSRAPPPAFS